MRFITEEVAFVGNIESMFYQVKVSDSKRSLLRYLWWKNNELNGDLVDYEIGTYCLKAHLLQDVAIMH